VCIEVLVKLSLCSRKWKKKANINIQAKGKNGEMLGFSNQNQNQTTLLPYHVNEQKKSFPK
jgi:hypothetical protein